jgi:hypothetical protein
MSSGRRGLAGLAAGLLVGCAATAPAPPPGSVTPPAVPPAAPAAPAPLPAPAPTTESTGAVRLLCDHGLELRASFEQDQVRLSGLPEGPEALLRDAGGVTPQQSVFSNPRLRAEFGLGADGREAALHLLQPFPRTLHCRRG